MDNSLASNFLKHRLAPGEKIIYQAPRNWFKLVEALGNVLFALLLGVIYVMFSVWQQNISSLNKIPLLANQSDADLAQGVGFIRLGVLALAVFALFFSLVQLAVLFGAEAALTDRRILGKTGRNILRLVDIPLDKIAWVDFPNRIFSKGPINIHTEDGKGTTLWNLARPDIFLRYLEAGYAAESKPEIRKQTMWGVVVLTVLGFAVVVMGIYITYVIYFAP